MTTKVNLIPLSQTAPGMILAADVCDAGGAGLLATETELSQDMIASLQHRSVAHIQITEKEILPPEPLAARQAEIMARVDTIFRQSGDAPLMVKLREALRAYRLEGLE